MSQPPTADRPAEGLTAWERLTCRHADVLEGVCLRCGAPADVDRTVTLADVVLAQEYGG